MVMQYVPHLIKAVVAKVSEVTQTRTPPLTIGFLYGNYQSIAKQMSDKRMRGDQQIYPMVVLIQPFSEPVSSKAPYRNAAIRLLILDKMNPNNSQQETEDQILFPRLWAVYEEIINQLKIDSNFLTSTNIDHTFVHHPYWGANEAKTIFQDNVFDDTVEVIEIRDMKLSVYPKEICLPFKS